MPIDPRQQPDNLTVSTVSGLLAETIMNVFADDSVSAIFGGENQLSEFPAQIGNPLAQLPDRANP